MKLIYSEIIGQAWKSLRDDLALVAGLSLVYLFGIWVLNHIPFIGNLIALPLGVGYIQCILKIRARQTIDWQDFLWGFLNFNRLLHVLLMQVLVSIGYFMGFLLLIIPGIWWIASSAFATPLFVLRKQDAIESITKSIEMVKGRWWNIFGFILILAMINVAGAICLLIGLLVSLPVSALALIIAAERILAATEVPPPVTGDSDYKPVEATVVSQT